MLVKYLALLLYFGILFIIGIVTSKKIKGLADYYVGGKKLGYWVVAFSARATGESAWLLLGLTGAGAMFGVKAFWIVVGEVIGVSLAWLLLAKPFKRLTDQYNSITIPDYLVSRFNAKTHTIRLVAATTLAIFVTIYVSAQIDATGKAFETFLEWNYFAGIFAGFFIVVAYIFIGGFVAVAWSDFFQGLLMMLGLLVLPIVAYFYMPTEAGLWEGLHQIDPDLLNVWGTGGFTSMNVMSVIGYCMIGIGFLGSPQIFVRFMSIKSENEINKGRWVAIIFTLLTDSAAVFIGLIGRYIFTELGQDPVAIMGNDAENVLPMLVEYTMPLILVGAYVAIVLSAIMSTIDSLLVLASSAITRDFYQQIYRPDLKEENLANTSRIVTLLIALFALSIAIVIALLVPGRTIFWFVIFGWSGIAATFCPVIILSLLWKGYTEKGAIASMITGFLCIPLFKFVVPKIGGIGPYFNALSELPPSFAMAILVGVIVSKITANKSLALT